MRSRGGGGITKGADCRGARSESLGQHGCRCGKQAVSTRYPLANHARRKFWKQREVQDGSQGEKICEKDSHQKTEKEISGHVSIGNENGPQGSSKDWSLKRDCARLRLCIHGGCKIWQLDL
jgi:hypothetical protein